MRVLVDYDMCESNGICEEIAPEVFHVSDEDDILQLLQERPANDLRAKVEEAVRKCPKRALSIEEG
jgi:ferredoxin